MCEIISTQRHVSSSVVHLRGHVFLLIVDPSAWNLSAMSQCGKCQTTLPPKKPLLRPKSELTISLIQVPPSALSVNPSFLDRMHFEHLQFEVATGIVSGGARTGKKKVYTTTVETLRFSFSGSEALWCIPFFPDLWCIPFSLVFPGKGYTPQLFLLCDLRVGRQTEKRGVPRWWCILFFPCQKGLSKPRKARH